MTLQVSLRCHVHHQETAPQLGGLNIKLASKLVGYEIDVYRELETGEEEDVDLEEIEEVKK